jgi:hypothetical protein
MSEVISDLNNDADGGLNNSKTQNKAINEDKKQMEFESNEEDLVLDSQNSTTEEGDVKTNFIPQDTISNQQKNSTEGTSPNPNGFFAETKSEKACSVCVAVRVRPLIGRELVVHERI